MNAVATPSTTKKPRARSPVPESTKRPFRGTIKREGTEPETTSPAGTSEVERNFMAGKALACRLIVEAQQGTVGGPRDIFASCRSDEVLVPQDNFAAPIIDLLLIAPELAPGFTAALSSLLNESVDRSAAFGESTARICFEACTVFHPFNQEAPYDGFTAPELDQQLATLALEGLSTAPLPSNGNSAATVAKVPGVDSPAAVRSTDDVLTEVGGVHDSAKHVLGDWIDSGSRDSAAFGFMTLVDRIEELMDAADRDADHPADLFQSLSVAFLEAAYVGRAVISWAHEDVGLWAVVHLLDHCKHLVDEHVDDLTEAAARKRMSDG